MGRSRVRFCPHGHDKDIIGGSYWSTRYNEKGILVAIRQCAECIRREMKARYYLKVLRLRPRSYPSQHLTQGLASSPRL